MSEVRTCGHLKANGEPCRAAAVRDKDHCFFHARATMVRNLPPNGFAITLPILDCYQNIQAALDQTAHAVASGRVDTRRASVLLRAIQLAAANLPFVAAATQPSAQRDQPSADMPAIAKPAPAPASAPSNGSTPPAVPEPQPDRTPQPDLTPRPVPSSLPARLPRSTHTPQPTAPEPAPPPSSSASEPPEIPTSSLPTRKLIRLLETLRDSSAQQRLAQTESHARSGLAELDLNPPPEPVHLTN